MRAMLPIAACCGILALSACATRSPVAERTPTLAPKPTAIAKNNRFEMNQNGRRMSADDFDAWMKARGIRVAKGPQAATRAAPPSKSKSKAPPKPQRKP